MIQYLMRAVGTYVVHVLAPLGKAVRTEERFWESLLEPAFAVPASCSFGEDEW